MTTRMICLVLAALGLAVFRGVGQAVTDSHLRPGSGSPWSHPPKA